MTDPGKSKKSMFVWVGTSIVDSSNPFEGLFVWIAVYI